MIMITMWCNIRYDTIRYDTIQYDTMKIFYKIGQFNLHTLKDFNCFNFSILDRVLVDEVMVEAGSNVSIGCPGMTRNTFVVQLEWRCRGECGGGDDGGSSTSKKSRNPQVELVKRMSCEESAIFFSNLAYISHIRQNHTTFL